MEEMPLTITYHRFPESSVAEFGYLGHIVERFIPFVSRYVFTFCDENFLTFYFDMFILYASSYIKLIYFFFNSDGYIFTGPLPDWTTNYYTRAERLGNVF